MNHNVLRFAPSPTGSLHLGGARTAFFNHAFAKCYGGVVRLRIEDTDFDRNSVEHVDQIINSLLWLGLTFDGNILKQSTRSTRHVDIAHSLIRDGLAYYCRCSIEEIENERSICRQQKRPYKYDGRCRDRGHVTGVVRINAKKSWSQQKANSDTKESSHVVSITDDIKGLVSVPIEQIDDYVILRMDGSPTYMLCSVVDDHDMNVSVIIRGDDHLTNTLRQAVLLRALTWPVPKYLHLGLVHASDGSKMSKRKCASGIDDLRRQGYLPTAICQYLLTLGWLSPDSPSVLNGDLNKSYEELMTQKLSASCVRFDLSKLNSINRTHMRMRFETDRQAFVSEVCGLIHDRSDDIDIETLISEALPRSFTMTDIADVVTYSVHGHKQHLCNERCSSVCRHISSTLSERSEMGWNDTIIAGIIFAQCEMLDISKKELCATLRWHMTNRKDSISLFKLLVALGKHKTLEYLSN